jgi:RNA polymerase sigma-70 factor (ECF subfamily)
MDRSLVLAAAGAGQLAAEKGIDLNYELTKGFAGRYIRRKAKQLVGKARFTASDEPEIEQNLRITLLRRLPKFNPARRHWIVFATMVIDRRVATILESRRTKKCEHIQNITSLSVRMVGEDGEWTELGRMVGPEHKEGLTGKYARSAHDQCELAQDVETVLSRLPDDLRDLCERLKTRSLSEIARDTGVPRSTLNDRLRKVRKIFAAAGLKSFLLSVR